MQVSRRYITLLEVLIGMGLITILMGALMGFFTQFEYAHASVERTREEAFELRYLQARLGNILPRIISPVPPVGQAGKKNDFFFYTSSDEASPLLAPSLVFTYNNGSQLDSLFANHVIGRLFAEQVGDKRQLVLATWPMPRCSGPPDPPMHREVLMDNISELAFAFFAPNKPEMVVTAVTTADSTKDATLQEERPTPETDHWINSWNIAYNSLPALMQVRIQRPIKTGLTPPNHWFELTLPLPNAKAPIVIERL